MRRLVSCLAPVPNTAAEAFLLRERAALTLRLDVSGISVCTHFFSPGELEFDVDPREVNDTTRLEALSEFVSRLGKTLERAVVLSHENRSQHPIATYSPGTRRFSYPPPASNSGAA
jgi:hypothetical protein